MAETETEPQKRSGDTEPLCVSFPRGEAAEARLIAQSEGKSLSAYLRGLFRADRDRRRGRQVKM